MDRHKVLRAYSYYKKLALQLQQTVNKTPTRNYTALRSVASEDSLLTGDFSGRKYTPLTKKAK